MSREEVEKANDIHILDYLNAKGENIIKQGNKYYRHAEHDSLIFNENGKWYWNSKGEGGFGSISFARMYYDLSFQEAVRDVNSQTIERSYTDSKNYNQNQEFSYPHHYETKGVENATNYLVNERCIDEKIVLALFKHDLIAEDKLKNCVFKWRDKEGNIVGADRQGTVKMENKRGTFKQIMANSKGDGGFTLDIGSPKKLAVFESPIDALSYFDLKRPQDIRLQSMSGLKDAAMLSSIRNLLKECKERGEKLEKVIIAVDNDKAGLEFTKRWENVLGNKSQIDIPNNKDWNDDLKQERTKEKTKQFSHDFSKDILNVER
ncbi:MAG: DUF3991 domain-containing protein [Bacillaceae bacterium]